MCIFNLSSLIRPFLGKKSYNYGNVEIAKIAIVPFQIQAIFIQSMHVFELSNNSEHCTVHCKHTHAQCTQSHSSFIRIDFTEYSFIFNQTILILTTILNACVHVCLEFFPIFD